MTDPITIPLTDAQQAFFAGLKAQEQAVQNQRNAAAHVIIAGLHDPKTLTGVTKIDVDGPMLTISFAPDVSEPTNRIAALNGAKKQRVKEPT